MYFFTHKSSGKKYVGSSNDLARRFKQYFDKDTLFNNKNIGLLLPLIDKEGLSVFTLEIITIPTSYPKDSHLFLEQYHLLDKSHDLNTHRVVNFRANQGLKIYLYDIPGKILYYTSNSLNAFCADLGIHHSSYKKCISKNIPFLDFFTISNTFIEEAVSSDLTESDLRKLINEQRKKKLDKAFETYGKKIEVFDKKTNEKKIYSSISKVAERLGTSRTTIRNYTSNGKIFKDRYLINDFKNNGI